MSKHEQLVEFLQEHLAIPTGSIELGLRQSQDVPSLLPMVLYQYGLVTTHELGQIFDWLESFKPSTESTGILGSQEAIK
jgi:hypothetical protein